MPELFNINHEHGGLSGYDCTTTEGEDLVPYGIKDVSKMQQPTEWICGNCNTVRPLSPDGVTVLNCDCWDEIMKEEFKNIIRKYK